MSDLGTFPFGIPVEKVEQRDRTPKKVFVLGVYSNPVNARWLFPDGKTFIMAVAIANEPEIYWRGNPQYVNKILSGIMVPPEMGSLVAAHKNLNGAAGRALDYNLLNPLGLKRSQTWLCDLIPYALANKSQRKALRKYFGYMEKYDLPETRLKPDTIKSKLINKQRVEEIAQEIKESRADLLITLGDLPLHHFVRHYNENIKSLSSFEKYGQIEDVTIEGKKMMLLPVVYPRQAGKKGKYSKRWYGIHNWWVNNEAAELLKDII